MFHFFFLLTSKLTFLQWVILFQRICSFSSGLFGHLAMAFSIFWTFICPAFFLSHLSTTGFWTAWATYKSKIICHTFSLSTCWDLEVQFHCLCDPVSVFPALRSLQLSNARTFSPCNCVGPPALIPLFIFCNTCLLSKIFHFIFWICLLAKENL